jgi:capsular exopolysaccharide synthesis family protein
MNPMIDSRKVRSNGHKPVRRELTLTEYLAVFLRGKWTILVSLGLVTAAAAVYTIIASPVYESSALVLVDMKGMNGSMPFSLDLTGAATINKLANELEVLKSRSLAQSVAQKLLEKTTLTPNSRKRIPIIEFVGEDDSSLVLGSTDQIMERLDKAVDFTPLRETDIIKVSARSTNPREAALLANVYAESYVERNMNTSRSRSRAVREFLQAQRESKKQTLDTTESALQAYMHSSGTVSLDEETKKVVEQLSQLEAGRDAIRVDMSSREKTLTSYKEELARQEPAVARSIGESNDSYLRLLQEELAKLEVQRDVIVAQNPDMAGQKIYYDKVGEIDKQIISLKEKLQSRTSEFMKSLVPSLPGEGSGAFLAQTRQKIIEQQIELEGLSARERAMSGVIADYENQFGRIPQKSMDLARLQRSRLSAEKLYLLIEEKFNESAITEKSEFGYVDIIDAALVPIKPVSPKVAFSLIFGVLAGLSLGVAIVLIRERLELRIRTPEDLKRFGFKTVSTISRMVGNKRILRKSTIKTASRRTFDPHLIAFHSPLSSLAESYRNLRTNVQFGDPERSPKSVMVTSANPSEGKSTTVANLAIAFAQSEKTVLLVDADLRRPSLHTFFNIPKSPGLTDYLLQNSVFDEVIQKNICHNLDIICSGTTAPNPAEMPGSQNMKTFINMVTEIYDVVLFDSAPVLFATDASVLGKAVEGTILVVSAGDTRNPEIERAMESLGIVGGSVQGVVLNNFDARKAYGGYNRVSGRSYGYGQYGIQEAPKNAKGKHKLN